MTNEDISVTSCVPAAKSARHYPRHRRQHPVVALVIDAIHPYSRGGREVRYHELTRRLADRADYHVYTMHWWSGPRTHRDEGITYHAVSRLSPMYTEGRRSIWQAMLFALGCLRLLGRRFDVLEADHMPYFHVLVLRVIATLKRKRFVVTWHEVWGPSYWREYLGRAGRAAWLVEWLAMRLPDHIVAASPQTAQRLQAILGARTPVTIAPNGVDLAAINSACPDSERTDLVVVSRLLAHKRVSMLLDAVALLHAEGRPVTCRVIGDGPERAALHGQAQALGVSHAVDFRHDVREHKEIYALVKAADVFVFPSDREGFGAAVLEAVACGVPVVTTSSPDNLAQHLVARSSRGVICAPSAPALADAVKDMLASQHPRPTGGSVQVNPWLTRYSWEATAAQVASALQI